MKQVYRICLIILFSINFANFVHANDEVLIEEQSIQTKINNCGLKILNANKIQKRVVFVYENKDKESILKSNDTLLNREVILYDTKYKNIENEDELAAFLSREIVTAVRSYDGIANGFLRSMQMKAAPKKFEVVADKRAVDYMVTSGYNPIGLITYIQKTSPQKKQDLVSFHNLTSKRLAIIYEYIYTKYPYYLKENPYLYSESYQNFLLTSINNRKKLEEKIKTNSKDKVKYE